MQKDKDYVVYTISLQGKVMYVGSTTNFENRKKQHLSKDKRLWSAIPSDVDASMVTIEIVRHWKSEKAMINCEGRLIEKYDTINNGWNTHRSGFVTSNKYEYWKEYNANRKEKIRIYQRRWLENHREKWNEYQREYQREYYRLKKIKIVG